MIITLEIGLELEAELARQAAAHGVGIDAYAASLLGEAARPKLSSPAKDVVEAIERLRVFGNTHGLSLGGMTIRELRHEARP